MDIILLRQTLKELNPFFWNAAIDSQFKDSKHLSNRSPVESAFSRYIITLRNKKGKKRIKDLFKEVENCLIPYDKACEVLLKEFPNSFAQQVLFTNEKLIRNFTSATKDNYGDWASFVVCMSHKDFWADLASIKPAETERKTTPSKIINIENFKGILGDVQAENVQTGNHASIHKHPKIKKIGTIIGSVAAFLAILYYLGWLGPIKAFIGKILWPK